MAYISNNQILQKITQSFNAKINYGSASDLNNRICEAKNVNDCKKLLWDAHPNAISNYVITSFLNKRDNEAWGLQKALFYLVIRNNFSEKAMFNAFINLAGYNNDMKEAEEALIYAESKRMIDGITYVNFIKAAGNNGDFDAVEESLKSVKINEHIFNRYSLIKIYNTAMKAAINNEKFVEAEKIFSIAKSKKIDDCFSNTHRIEAACKKGDFERALALFTEANKLNKIDAVTCAIIIQFAGCNKNIEAAKNALAIAERKNKLDKELYAIYIKAVGENGDIPEARKALKKAEANPKLLDSRVYNNFIYVSIKNGFFEEANTIRKIAEDKNMVDPVIYNIFVPAAKDNNKIEAMIDAFKTAKQRRKLDTLSCNSIIEAFEMHRDFNLAKEALDIAERNQKVDTVMYANYMMVAIEHIKITGDIDELVDLLEKAEAKNMVDELTYRIAIGGVFHLPNVKYGQKIELVKRLLLKAEEKSHVDRSIYECFIDFLCEEKICNKIRFNFAMDLFKRAEQRNMINDMICGKLIKAAGNNRNVEAIIYVLEVAIKTGIAHNNIALYNAYITAISHNGAFDKAYSIYKELVNDGIADRITQMNIIDAVNQNRQFHSIRDLFISNQSAIELDEKLCAAYITAAGNSNDYDAAKKMWKLAKEKNLISNSVCNNIIQVAGSHHDFATVEETWEIAKNEEALIDSITYINYIVAACNNCQFDLAERCFDELKVMGLENDRIYHSFISACVKNDNIKLACKKYKEANLNLGEKLGETFFNLHGESYGSAFVGVLLLVTDRWKKDSQSVFPIRLMIGRGWHSKKICSIDEQTPLKAAMEALATYLNLDLIQIADNPGSYDLKQGRLPLNCEALKSDDVKHDDKGKDKQSIETIVEKPKSNDSTVKLKPKRKKTKSTTKKSNSYDTSNSEVSALTHWSIWENKCALVTVATSVAVTALAAISVNNSSSELSDVNLTM